MLCGKAVRKSHRVRGVVRPLAELVETFDGFPQDLLLSFPIAGGLLDESGPLGRRPVVDEQAGLGQWFATTLHQVACFVGRRRPMSVNASDEAHRLLDERSVPRALRMQQRFARRVEAVERATPEPMREYQSPVRNR